MIVVIDAQKGFSTDSGHVSNIAKLVDEADDVLFTVFSEETPERYVSNLGWTGLDEETKPIQDDLASLDSEYPVIERDTYDLTQSQEFIDIISEQEQVYLTGFETDACVLATAYGLFDMDIVPTVVQDACYTSAGRDVHQSAIQILRRNIGDKNIKDTREVLYRM